MCRLAFPLLQCTIELLPNRVILYFIIIICVIVTLVLYYIYINSPLFSCRHFYVKAADYSSSHICSLLIVYIYKDFWFVLELMQSVSYSWIYIVLFLVFFTLYYKKIYLLSIILVSMSLSTFHITFCAPSKNRWYILLCKRMC